MHINLTEAVQESLKNYWSDRLEEIENEMRRADDIVEYLNDLKYVNTPDYILRRHIILCNEFEVDETLWDAGNESKVNKLCKRLNKLSRDAGTDIKKIDWKGYLQGTQGIQRKTAFKLAYLLKMDETTFLKFLYSIDEETINYRDPEEFIHYYCICKNRSYSWIRANNLVDKYYELRDKKESRLENRYEMGYTTVLSNKFKDFLNSDIPEAELEEELISYMLQNEEWFYGYSVKRAGMLMHMCKYLYKKYPHYINGDDPDKIEYVQTYEDGVPNHTQLCKTMFEGGFALRKGEKSDAFRAKIQSFCKSYYSHIRGIHRNIIGIGMNYKPVTRRDVILLSFLFFSVFTEDEHVVSAESLPKYEGKDDRIRKIYENEEVKKLDDILKSIQEDENFKLWAENTQSFGGADDRLVMFTDFMNQILNCFGFEPMYVPNPFDRFILLCLMDEEPYDLWDEAMSEAF